MPAMSDYELGA